MKKKIVILGAGFAGLAAALDLLKKGYDVSIIDKESYVGGLCTTFQNKGFYFDVGDIDYILNLNKYSIF